MKVKTSPNRTKHPEILEVVMITIIVWYWPEILDVATKIIMWYRNAILMTPGEYKSIPFLTVLRSQRLSLNWVPSCQELWPGCLFILLLSALEWHCLHDWGSTSQAQTKQLWIGQKYIFGTNCFAPNDCLRTDVSCYCLWRFLSVCSVLAHVPSIPPHPVLGCILVKMRALLC